MLPEAIKRTSPATWIFSGVAFSLMLFLGLLLQVDDSFLLVTLFAIPTLAVIVIWWMILIYRAFHINRFTRFKSAIEVTGAAFVSTVMGILVGTTALYSGFRGGICGYVSDEVAANAKSRGESILDAPPPVWSGRLCSFWITPPSSRLRHTGDVDYPVLKPRGLDYDLWDVKNQVWVSHREIGRRK